MGIAERKEREKHFRREQILEAAYQLFHEAGYSAATMDQIAERAELAKGTLYLYFKSKEEVYFALLNKGLEILIDLLEDKLRRRPPRDQILAEIANTLSEYIRDHVDYIRIFIVMNQEDKQAKLSDEICAQFNSRAATILKLMRNEIQALIDEGAFIPVNAWQVANLLWAAFNGISQWSLAREQMKISTPHLHDLLGFCFQVIERGLSLNNENTSRHDQNQLCFHKHEK